MKLPIFPSEGEMAGRPEGGECTQRTHAALPCRCPASAFSNSVSSPQTIRR